MSSLRYFEGDGLQLTASAFGDPEAMPVCFFHGGGQSRRSWERAAKAVGEQGYYGLSFDLRGHGDSGWAGDGDYILDAYARDVERLLEQFGRPAVLVGASRGGQAAFVAASRHQDRVKLVMLADVAPVIEDTGVDGIRAFLHASLEGFDDIDEAADALAAYLNQPRVKDASGLKKAMRERDGRLFWHWDPLTVSPEFLNPPSETQTMTAAARIIKCPVVLVKAEHSSIVTQEGVAQFRQLVPQLIVEEAKGAHHMFTGDRNDSFAVRLLHHLRESEAIRG